jgi:hypothetical protein
MNCSTCTPAKPADQAFEDIKTEAREYAKKENKAVAIYKEGDEFKYLDAFDAYARGYGPIIREVVSKYNGTAIT